MVLAWVTAASLPGEQAQSDSFAEMNSVPPVLPSAYASALSGLNRSVRLFEGSAARVAQFGAERVSISDEARAMSESGVDLAAETVTQTTSALAFRANLKTFATAQSLDEALLAMGAVPDSDR